MKVPDVAVITVIRGPIHDASSVTLTPQETLRLWEYASDKDVSPAKILQLAFRVYDMDQAGI